MTDTKTKKPALAYTVEEFAKATGLGVSTVRELLREGKLIGSYVGRKPLITVAEADRFMSDLPAEKQ